MTSVISQIIVQEILCMQAFPILEAYVPADSVYLF